jgi:hypothetical protein
MKSSVASLTCSPVTISPSIATDVCSLSPALSRFCLTAESRPLLQTDVEAVQQLPSSPAQIASFLGMTAYSLYATTVPAARVVKEGRVDMDQRAWENGRAQAVGLQLLDCLPVCEAVDHHHWGCLQYNPRGGTVSAPPRLIAFTSGALSSAQQKDAERGRPWHVYGHVSSSP